MKKNPYVALCTVCALFLSTLTAYTQQTTPVRKNPFTQAKGRKHVATSILAVAPAVPKTVYSFATAPVIHNITTEQLSARQREALYAMFPSAQKPEFYFDATSKIPFFVQGQKLSRAYSLTTNNQVVSATQDFLQRIAPVLTIENPNQEFAVTSVERDALGKTHVRLQQQYNEIPVWGCDAVVHFNTDGTVETYNGRTVASLDANYVTVPEITGERAVDFALDKVNTVDRIHELSATAQTLLDYTQPQRELVIFPSRTVGMPPSLAWHITVRPNLVSRWECFIDAKSGKVLFTYSNSCPDGPKTAQAPDLNSSTKTINTYQFQNNYWLIDASRPMFNNTQSQFPNKTVGTIWTLDSKQTDLQDIFNVTTTTNSWSDRSSVSAHSNGATTYEYFRQVHARNSIDGNGGTIVSVIHVTEGGQGMDNAFWNGKLMAYGDGLQAFKPLAGGLDVAAHEMTHGVTENSAALVYLSQSGAINESMSDVFGCMVDRDDWLIGEDVVRTSAFPTGALRNMENPHNGGNSLNDRGWQPAHMNEYQKLPETQDGDNGGVHVNSGIPNRACFLLAQAIGKEKTEKIYYRTLTSYLTKSSQFIDLRRAVIRSAQELYGASEVTAAGNAFDAVGITDGSGSTGPKDQSPVNGTEWILLHNTDFQSDPNSLYIVKPDNPQTSDFHPISKTKVNRRPSVVDDGSVAVFVAADNTLHAITLNTTSPQESILSTSTVWENVAVSRDGNRLAVVSTEVDSSIWVYNLAVTPVAIQRFYLYTPTTGSGVRNYTIQFADAVEWDFSGQFVLFDAFNSVSNNQGDTLEYWNIGMLRAFDVAGKKFSDGLVLNLIPTLDQGIDVGNPTFSKNSPNIIAFDMFDSNNDRYAIIGMNTETSDGAVITLNSRLGTPSYGKNDNRIAFTSYNTNNQPVAKILQLKTDKISPLGTDAIVLATDAEYPVFYTQGQRPVAVEEEQLVQQQQIQCAPNPASTQLTVTIPTERQIPVTVTLFDVLGNSISTMQTEISPLQPHVDVPVSQCPDGAYMLRVTTQNTQRSVPVMILR
ncbi:MAG: M4 family metallopeptidase [Candidatus Kapaibacterium sp.]